MGKSKQNKQPKKDGNHRAETREERLKRLKEQEEARQACFKMMPYAGGAIVFFLLIFAVYVRSVPPRVPKPKTTDAQRTLKQAGIPEFMQGVNLTSSSSSDGFKPPADEEPVPPKEPAPEEGATGTESNDEHVEL